VGPRKYVVMVRPERDTERRVDEIGPVLVDEPDVRDVHELRMMIDWTGIIIPARRDEEQRRDGNRSYRGAAAIVLVKDQRDGEIVTIAELSICWTTGNRRRAPASCRARSRIR
jgi:hypothetical protein